MEKRFRISITDTETGEPIKGFAGKPTEITTDLALFCAVGGEDENGSAWLNGILMDRYIDENILKDLARAAIKSFEHMVNDHPEWEAVILGTLLTNTLYLLRDQLGLAKTQQLVMMAAMGLPEAEE